MKSIAIFILVGLSLFGNGHCVDVEANAEPNECLANGIKKTPGVLKKVRDAICKYEKAEETDDDQDPVTELKTEVKSVLTEIGCADQQISGLDLDTASTTSETVSDVVKLLQPSLDEVGLKRSILNVLCKLANPTFTSECLNNLVKEPGTTVKNTLSLAQQLSCEVRKGAGLSWKTVKDILDEAMCDVGEVSELKALENATDGVRKLVKEDLKHLLHDILDNTTVKGTLNNSLCTGIKHERLICACLKREDGTEFEKDLKRKMFLGELAEWETLKVDSVKKE
ncbi:uncharacterized protein [Dendropsophus ebraccatus]|uniref:uncharacterized protein n=1 Tax=Dendropsophus ebraccatus TaxID=150705 RepID=UPI003831BED7